MMGIFLEVFDNRVKSYIFDGEKLSILRREGEEELDFDESFWEWLRGKIEYEGEEVSFLVVSDRDEFEIKGFNIAKRNIFEGKEINHKKGKVFAFPFFEIEKIEEEKEVIQKSSTPLMEYFIKKSKEYKKRWKKVNLENLSKCD
jgi:hypothetical protein